MKFTLIFKEALQRPRFFDIESESLESVTTKDIPEQFLGDMVFLYGAVDYEGARTIPAAITADGRVVSVPDGDFGELTPAEYLEEQS